MHSLQENMDKQERKITTAEDMLGLTVQCPFFAENSPRQQNLVPIFFLSGLESNYKHNRFPEKNQVIGVTQIDEVF